MSEPIGRPTLSLSQDTTQMFNDDKKCASNKYKSSTQLTQEKQQTSVDTIMLSNVSKNQVVISIVRITMKILDGKADLESEYVNILEGLTHKFTKEINNQQQQ